MTLAITKFVTCDLSGEIRKTPFNIGQQLYPEICEGAVENVRKSSVVT
jgi:hypothetical protein